ncbi:MAG TPA: cisplatin damage response ATP-dependent DNA ligase [Aestuariivirgaceae bacterium]|nr:cisplatin damage response ATP-dependent DNA ligase [Aestuariivirgaceae bacterium]
MQAFAGLIDRLVYTPSRNRKLDALADYFRDTPDPDRGYALAALTDGLFVRLPLRRILAQLLEPHVDPVLYRLSRDYVGDTAETVALLWPEDHGVPAGAPPRLAEAVEAIAAAGKLDAARVIAGFLDRLDADGRFALLKLMTGALRTGVSARLAKTGLARWANRDVSEIEEHWHGLEPPYLALFAWLEGRGPPPDTGNRPRLRHFMLAHPIENADWSTLEPSEFVAEWKWDGIRVQLAAGSGEICLFSRGGDDVSAAFPDLVESFTGLEVVADGELLLVRGGAVMPFNDLQQRLNRKTVTPRMLEQHPAHLRLYDLLVADGEDLRPLPFVERRRRLETWHANMQPPRSDLSELIDFHSFEELDALWAGARARQLEGLMLKRKSSPYVAGRTRGHWFKWKRDPLTLDCVLMYAQRGSGKRSSYYSDYTFGLWRGDELVPVGKSYFGFTDEELLRLDRFIRGHTSERFGPVRAVEPKLVLEVAFDAVQPSTRHKSGLAMRFPRIHRIRWDKPAGEADRLETLAAFVEK